jgi:unsaturated rhamnogalacturonyl hydrolase
MIRNQRLALLCIILTALTALHAQPLSEKLALTAINKWPDSLLVQNGKPAKWSYDQGVVMEGMEAAWNRSANPVYFNYIQKYIDFYVKDDGNILTYNEDDFNIDNIKNGRSLLLLYKVTGKLKYLKAAARLRDQLQHQPSTSDGGFWHKKIYPSQMWLDGIYMAEPFYAEYAALMHEDTSFNNIARQFILMEHHARDPKTGLLYHGWDESKQQRWANRQTGVSPSFWDRAMGWYAMALVDVLDYFPANHPERTTLLAILKRTAASIQKYQDASSGLWYQVMDKATEKGNYKEASGSCMFVYALAKAARKGYLQASYLAVAQKGYKGIIKEFIEKDAAGYTNLKGTVSVAGLGGDPYRDGSYAYYLSEKVVTNDAKGVGAFILASNELEIAALPKTGRGKIVTLDYFFNNETIKTGTGFTESYHYKWDERDNNGSAFFAQAFTNTGAAINHLSSAPDQNNLKRSDIYIIVDPDTKKEAAQPNYIMPDDIRNITDWVKAGGVLVLMGNDSGNAEFEHFNQLATNFGIHFNEDSKNHVIGSQYEMGKIAIPANNPILKNTRKIYIKEYSSITIKSPASHFGR